MKPRTEKVATYTYTKSYCHELSHEEREKMIRGISARNPGWVLKACEYLENSSKQPDLQIFCKTNGLPYDNFRVFLDLMMTDIQEEIDTDPFLRKVCSLPPKYQKEYAALNKKRRNLLIELAEIYSKTIGEKVEVRDFYDKEKSDEIDAKLKNALNHKNADHLLGALRSTQIFNEIDAIDEELKQFCQRHGIK